MPKFQIFISSTYEDMKVERDRVIKAVLEMGHIPVGMEMFSAADEEQWQIIARHIDESDYYVVLVAHAYGSVTEEGISYTRKEYEYARAQGIPCLGFIISPSAHWPADLIDQEKNVVEKLKEFKTLIKQKPVNFWTDATDLHGKFAIALSKTFNTQPRPGWVRATEAVTEATHAELTRLSAENASLRQQAATATAKSQATEASRLRETLVKLRDVKVTPSYKYEPFGEWNNDVTVSLLDVFRSLSPSMMIEQHVNALAESLAMDVRKDKERSFSLVAVNQVSDYLSDLLTLDLVEPSKRKHPVADTNEYWSLSTKGKALLKWIRRVAIDLRVKQSEKSDGGEGKGSPADVSEPPVK